MRKRFIALASIVLLLAALFALQVIFPVEQAAGSQITGRVYFDENADEDCQTCECGIADVNITLYEGPCGGRMLQKIYTDADGFFQFKDVAPGSYCVFSGLAPTCDGYLPTTSLSRHVVVDSGGQFELDWFGYDLYTDALKGFE